MSFTAINNEVSSDPAAAETPVPPAPDCRNPTEASEQAAEEPLENETKSSRKSPTPQKEKAAMEKAVEKLKAKICAEGGRVPLPPGLSAGNSVIARIYTKGVPNALACENEPYNKDEDEFMLRAAGENKGRSGQWAHSVTAAYLGRSCQATRLRAMKLRRYLARERAARSALQQGAPSSSSVAGPSQETVFCPPMLVERFRSWSSIRTDNLSPEGKYGSGNDVQAGDTSQVPRPAPVEPATNTTFKLQAMQAPDSAPANHSTTRSALGILATAAAAARSRPKPPPPPAPETMDMDVGVPVD